MFVFSNRPWKPWNSVLVGLLFVLVRCAGIYGQATVVSASVQLAVTGDVDRPLALSLESLRKMPRQTIRVMNEHGGEAEVYQGVPVAELLKQAGVPYGPQLRGASMAIYVLAEGSDGYRVTFSLAELDSDFQDSDVIVADTLNGGLLDDKLGPLRLVAPHDRRPARWVRMLQSIRVVRAPK